MSKYSESEKDGNRKDFKFPHKDRQSNEDSQTKDSRSISTTYQCHKVAPQNVKYKQIGTKHQKLVRGSDSPKNKKNMISNG